MGLRAAQKKEGIDGSPAKPVVREKGSRETWRPVS